MSRFYFGDDSRSASSDNDNDDEDNLSTLPFATPLRRSDFLAPNFSPATYLSTLHNRHQTLEDLRSELRSRSQLLSKELLDLVNSNYQDFLNLGNSLHGGEEKVEGARVGLLGFRKEVGGMAGVVGKREEEVGELLQERRDVRAKIDLGRRLVDYDARLKELEAELLIETAGHETIILGEEVSDSEDEEDEDEEEEGYGVSVAKLRRNVVHYRLVVGLQKELGEHPFVAAQAARIAKVRSTLLMDLSTALQQAKTANKPDAGRVMKVMKIYADMEESAEAVNVFKTLKSP
ncbi:oligomeric golgi complex component, COG2-domain-containing protein [Alternaria rosae]|uniref:oligomeric golgi complex component, COG2-domain-containing protein n=1 Tax=Alternaria rosae TaxID=1187941 RepID=UPI001E8D4FF3|nr:oligomeric golgi complex component, COG2-domain-containing protein [Alternaria rosae]KAH6882363.1 oligomeric golgi complex component, COG2-domain-containing protein [Alternaria rosae]